MDKIALDNSFEQVVLQRSTPIYKRFWFWILLLTLGIITTVSGILRPEGNSTLPRFKTAPVERGNLIVTVTATGTLQPVKQVIVGTEVSGTVKNVAVDYNDPVKAGQILAKLDTTKLEDQAAQSRALLHSAQAGLMEAQATVVESHKNLERLKEIQKLSGGKLPSRQELDTAEAVFKRASAGEVTAQAKIDEAQAKLKLDETNLAKATIRSPINGIVLTRGVEPGQTVAASLQAPVLFTLAEDLRQMILYVNVDEADVGQVAVKQPATFTISAYPDRQFQARITQVRYAARTENNVVTYEALLAVDNADLSLRPGMTATADIIVRTITNALLIPNVALRFSPPMQQREKGQSGPDFIASILPRPRRPQPLQPQSMGKSPQVWHLDDNGVPQPIAVKPGASDGRMTQILEGNLTVGQALLVDMEKTLP
jgi:HlyD family secretion protein